VAASVAVLLAAASSAVEVPATAAMAAAAAATRLPFGGTTIYPGRTLVAYYGTAGSGALGVLGEASPDRIIGRLRKATAPFGTATRPAYPVFELIVTVADAGPGRDGDYNHDITRTKVRKYIAAAHKHKVLLVLDVQPGRANFRTVAKRWAWALKDPWVGLALDPEWRVGKGQVPGRVVGSVRAAEVNKVSSWLGTVVTKYRLPQKLFLLHAFRTTMLPDIGRIAQRTQLATVLHVDGFGTRSQKRQTFRTLERTKPAYMRSGFKLFYDEDVRIFRPKDVLRIRPRVSFVSYQ
jgi:hypothetical protein